MGTAYNQSCSESCYSYDYKSIIDLQYRLKQEVHRLSNRQVASLYYGYGGNKGDDIIINRLHIFNKVLDRHKKAVLYNVPSCLCDEDLQSIVENIIDIVGKPACGETCPEVIIDDSNLSEWVLSNPTCVSYDSYEKYAIEFCGNLELKITAIQEMCDIAFSVSRDIINCDILLAATAYKEINGKRVKVDRTVEECKLDWKILVTEHKCDISLKAYLELIECNLSFNIIEAVYRKGCKLTKNSDDTVCITTPYTTHEFEDLAVNPCKLEDDSCLSTTMEKLLEDYNT